MLKFNKLCDLLLEGSAIRSYSCLMLDLSNIYPEIQKIHECIDPNDVYEGSGHGLEKECHTTVKYGIHEQKPSNFLPYIKLFPVKLTLSKLSLFENDEFDVLKFSVESKDLRKINKEVCELFEFTDRYTEYSPHCTVAYLQPGTGKKYLKTKTDLTGKKLESNKFIFSNAMSDKVWVTV